MSEHRLAAGLSSSEVDIFLSALIAMAEPVETHFLWRPQLRDPNDEMVLEAAGKGRADALVTFNVRDYGMAPAQFGVEVLLPREALARGRAVEPRRPHERQPVCGHGGRGKGLGSRNGEILRGPAGARGFQGFRQDHAAAGRKRATGRR